MSATIGTPDVLPAGVVPDSDLANAHRLQRLFGNGLRHASALGWLVWDGRRWDADNTGEVARRIHKVARAIELRAAELFAAAAKATDDAERSRLHKQAQLYLAWARKSQGEPRIRACADVAKTLDGIAITGDQLDRDDKLCTTLGGVLDLRTGNLRPHSREDLCTRIAPVQYAPTAKAPLWNAFLERVLPDPEVRAFVQRALGYSLTGATSEQCMFVLYGTGANGKSTLLETVRHVVGDFAQHAATDTLMASSRPRGIDNDLARLRGARFVTAIESGEARRLDEERIKALTGCDTITARFLYREHFEFRATFKLWLACNHKPEVRGTDEAIWRRLRLIEFGEFIPEHERDPELQTKLQAQAPGILAWLVAGALEWQRSGLRPPVAVLASGAAWRAEANDVARFVADCCTVLDIARCKSSVLYAAYRQWSSEQGLEPISAKAFGQRLAELGYRADRTNAEGRIWRGLGLTASQGDDA